MRAANLHQTLPGLHDRFENLRVLVLRENWLGNTGLSAFNALLRAGAWAESISERDYIPIEWKHPTMKALGRLLRKAAVGEFNRALLQTAKEMQPHLFLAMKG